MAITWFEWFWLPEGLTWSDLEKVEGSNYEVRDFIAHSFLTGVLMLIFRNHIVLPSVLRPLGLRLGIRSKPYDAPSPNPELEILFKINRARPPRLRIVETSKIIGWTERKVERWLRQKTLSTQMTTLEKFEECGWQCIFYSCFSIFGLYAVASKEFFWEPEKGWKSYPFFYVTHDLWWYCVIDCGFYLTQTYLLLVQDRRHDFYQMLCHHIACFLVGVSCMALRAVPLLALGIFLHEFVDIPLCISKMIQYAGRNDQGDIFAIIFTVVWVCSRIIAYPLRVLIPAYKATQIIGTSLWLGLLWSQICSTVFFVLNILWTFELAKAIKRKLTCSAHITDGRSSQEEMSEDETERSRLEETKLKGIVNRVHATPDITCRG
ncbi:ceramide synthase 5-like [Hyalella azteca]|uniref:Ceramide synthase 5-like n=1 Tax=Hyalella azteca TaxID=294128 RepID=A0A8B7PCJ5_HYAAZ|nr:ceramide synthase 5-like [Hyalella azteca]